MNVTTTQNYQNFQRDLWILTEQQIDGDTACKQKKYLEQTKKPRSIKSKEWIYRLKVMNNYLPRMKQGQKKYFDQELIEKIIWNTIPDAWEKDFEMFDGSRVTTIQQVQTILQKVECCENLEKRTEKKKENSQKNLQEQRVQEKEVRKV